MKMRTAQVLGMAGLMVMGVFGCRKVSKDSDKVLATVVGEKITAGEFQETAKLMLQDDKKVDDLLKNEAMKEQRNEFLESLALQKAMIRFAKAEGLAKDSKAQLLLEQAQARITFQLLKERRIGKSEPTEVQLRALYDELIAKRKAAGQDKGLPTFEDVKATMPGIWKQDQEQKVGEAILKDVKQKFPMTFAEGYKPTKPAGE
jgi:hypothetical protein